ncbi:MAG: methyltransferase, partial [Burkholderiales bacterium]|nr:methyltransferase [Burkholderiales bacterium]
MIARRSKRPPKKRSAEKPLEARLLELIAGGWTTQALFVAVHLGLADLLAEKRSTSAELAVATGAHAPSLHRLLRALATLGICRECGDGRFEITDMGALLGVGSPHSLRAWTIWSGTHMWPVWGNLLYSVQTGKSARALLTGASAFQHLEEDADAAAVFNQALVELTRLVSRSVVQAYDFSGLQRIVDVGGGHGELLASILKAYPTASGVLFDLPHAASGARAHLAAAGVAERCTFVEGDFFVSVPPGADAYLLKSVLHDWNDEDGTRILACCRRAMHDAAVLLLVERVVPEKLEVS